MTMGREHVASVFQYRRRYREGYNFTNNNFNDIKFYGFNTEDGIGRATTASPRRL